MTKYKPVISSTIGVRIIGNGDPSDTFKPSAPPLFSLSLRPFYADPDESVKVRGWGGKTRTKVYDMYPMTLSVPNFAI